MNPRLSVRTLGLYALISISLFASALRAATQEPLGGPNPTMTVIPAPFVDADGDGRISCGDTVQVIFGLTPLDFTVYEDSFLEIDLPARLQLVNGSVLPVNPNDPPAVTSGNRPGDSDISVEYGDVYGPGTAPVVGITLQFRAVILPPDSTGQARFQGVFTARGNQLTLLSNDPNNFGDPDPAPTLVEFPPCPAAPPPPVPPRLLVTQRDDLVLDADADGRADPGDVVGYTALLRSLDAPSLTTSYRVVPDEASVLIPGTVTTSQGTVAEGNGVGDGSVTVDIGPLAADGNPVTVRYQVTVLADVNPAVPLACQGAARTALTTRVSDDPDTAAPDDATLTPTDNDPDLAVTLSDRGESLRPGGVLALDLGWENLGTAVGRRAVLAAELAPGVSYHPPLSGSAAWECSAATCTLLLGDLSPGSSGALALGIRVDPDLPTAVTELVTAVEISDDGSSGPDVNPANNLAEEVTPVVHPTGVDLTVSKDDAGVSGTPGGLIEYRIDVRNSGDTPATGIVLTDPVAFGSAVLGQSSPGWSCAASGVCELLLASLAPGASASFVFTVRVAETLPPGHAVFENTVSVTDDGTYGPELTPLDNVASETTPLGFQVDLRVTKDDGGATVMPGRVVVYDVAWSSGPWGQTGVVVTDTLPAHTTFEPSLSDPGWVCTVGECRFDVGLLPGGTRQSAALAVRLGTAIPPELTALTNTVAIRDDGVHGPDANPADNVAVEETPVAGAFLDLAVTKDDGGATLSPGGAVVYTVGVENLGTVDATGVTLRDVFPGWVRPRPEQSSPGWVCTTSGCTFTVGDLGPGASVSTILTFRLDEVPGGVTELRNLAQVTETGPWPDSNSSNDLDEEFTPIVGASIDLALTKDDAGATVMPGGGFVYRFEVANLGNAGALNVEVVDTLPSGLAPAAAGSTPGWACVAGTCTIALGHLAAGAEPLTFELAVELDPDYTGGDLVNRAVITHTSIHPDSNPANNEAQETTPVLPSGPGPTALAITKADVLSVDADGDGLADPGDVITYVLELRAPGALSDLRLEAPTPLETSYVEGSAATSAGVIVGTDPLRIQVDALAPNMPLTVAFDVESTATDTVVCQAMAVAANAPPTLSDDPDTAEPGDPTLTPVDTEGTATPLAIPTASHLGLLLLALALGTAALRRLSPGPRGSAPTKRV